MRLMIIVERLLMSRVLRLGMCVQCMLVVLVSVVFYVSCAYPVLPTVRTVIDNVGASVNVGFCVKWASVWVTC